jgi:hypothetical protein
MCLPTAEAAKSDLVLDFSTAKSFEVAMQVSGSSTQYSDGVMKFESKTLESHSAGKHFMEEVVGGTHAVCDAWHSAFVPVESTLLLRGSTLANTLTLQTAPKDSGKDVANDMASGWCLEQMGDGTYAVDIRLNFDVAKATGTWSCAYLIDPAITFTQTSAEQAPADRTSVDPILRFADSDASNNTWSGTVTVPRSGC